MDAGKNADYATSEICPGCRAIVARIEGKPHPYLGTVAGCWNLYSEVLCREYGHFGYPDVHRMTIDAYSVQHVGTEGLQTIRSTALHLVGLCMSLEHKLPQEHVTRAIGRVRNCGIPLRWLEPPDPPGPITIRDVLGAATLDEHRAVVHEWARSVWQAWTVHHHHIRQIVLALGYGTMCRNSTEYCDAA